MNHRTRTDVRESVRTVLSSRQEGGMRGWLPRTGQPSPRPRDQVETELLQLRRALAKEGTELSGDIEKDAALVLTARRQGHRVDLVIGREIAPPDQDCRYVSWVEHNESVILTVAPVRELYEEVARW